MGVLADHQIRHRCFNEPEILPPYTDGNGVLHDKEKNPKHMVIRPFAESTKEEGKISWGLSHYGYDLRLGRNFRVFNDIFMSLIDPHTVYADVADRLKRGQFVDFKNVDYCDIPPNSFCLAESLEWVKVPRDCFAQITGKSTMARCGIGLTTTPIEPEWQGIITLEIPNHSRLPARVWAEEGIGQLWFAVGDEICEVSYADKKHSAYQNQPGLAMGRV